MLVVLTALVLTTTAATVAVRARISSRLSASVDHRSRIAADLLDASQPPIEHWLAHRSARLVLSPDTIEPSTTVLHDQWTAGANSCELRITAWDQCGMIPISALAQGHRLGHTASSRAIERARDIPREWLDHPGLDMLQNDDDLIFPVPRATTPTLYGSDNPVPQRIRPLNQKEVIALGALLATHNPPTQVRSRRGAPPIWLNVNTTPAPLLQEALRLAGLGGLDAALAARADGTGVALNALIPIGDAPSTAPIRFVTSSPSWAFRIDIRVGTLRRSWWEVWTNTSSNWEAVQRLAIID